MKKQAITEEQGVQKQWYEEAKKQTPESLPAFLNHLANDYQHDYGTYCHMVAASALGAAWAAGQGLSGFQAGAVMWQFVQEWQFSGNKCGLRILDYDNVLYPQYEDKFAGQSISESIWKAIRKEAKVRLLADAQREVAYAAEMTAYQLELKGFVERFPDFDELQDYYLPLSSGTGEQWKAEEAKKASGFEFAPREPYLGTAHPNVAEHWRRIVRGILPFRMQVEKD